MDISPLQGHLPDAVYAQLPATMTAFVIDDELKLAHFLGQCDLESNQFRELTEDLNYSVNALLSTFSKYFDATSAAAYARQPEKIGNRVYANRMGNGDEASGDGFRYRGRGYIQLTGKVNYKAFGGHIAQDLVTNPDLVATQFALESAAYYFQSRDLFAICDRGADNATITAVTRVVNGGTNGLAGRTTAFNKYYGLLKPRA